MCIRDCAEHTLLPDQPGTDRTGPFTDANWALGKTNPQWLFERLISNSSFKLRFADLVQKNFFNGGAFTPAAVNARLAPRIQQMGSAVSAESARWGDSKTAV